MSTEPGPSGGSAAEGVLEVAHFMPEQLAFIDRLIAARVESSSSTAGGAGRTSTPSSSTSSTSVGEHFLGCGRWRASHMPSYGTGYHCLSLPLVGVAAASLLTRPLSPLATCLGTVPPVYRQELMLLLPLL